MTTDRSEFTICLLTPDNLAALYDLRLRVLRPGLPPESAVFPEDGDSGTVHIGSYGRDGTLAGIATLVRNDGYQLRGMATEPSVRGSGAGAAALREAHRLAIEADLPLWCNARRAAVGFYERHGWETEGEEFDIPGVGPHFRMRWTGGI